MGVNSFRATALMGRGGGVDGNGKGKSMGDTILASPVSFVSDEICKSRPGPWGCSHIVRQESLVKEEVVKHRR